jgi:hypothetical protein
MRLVPEGLHKRYETILREFEWNWTKAAVAALILWFLAITFIGVIPSWWLYFAQRPPLNWTQNKFWLFKLRDLVAVILFTIPTLLFMLVPYYLQKHRQRLRGSSAQRPIGGYR